MIYLSEACLVLCWSYPRVDAWVHPENIYIPYAAVNTTRLKGCVPSFFFFFFATSDKETFVKGRFCWCLFSVQLKVREKSFVRERSFFLAAKKGANKKKKLVEKGCVLVCVPQQKRALKKRAPRKHRERICCCVEASLESGRKNAMKGCVQNSAIFY